jgi:hypothetical protein
MNGWIINLWDSAQCREEVRHGFTPVFHFEDGKPCFEVWFWHCDLYRWFVMSYHRDPRLEEQGVVYFHPDESPGQLRARFARLAIH